MPKKKKITSTRKKSTPRKKYFRPPRKTKSRIIAASPISNIIQKYHETSKNSNKEKALEQLRKTAQTLISGVNAAIRALERKGKAVFSYAAMQYRNSGLDSFTYTLSEDGKNIVMSDGKDLLTSKEIKNMGYHRLIMEISKAQDFLNSSTSYRAGVEKLNYEQDKRIFGTFENGAPKAEMTPTQRAQYWALYNSFMNSHPAIKEGGGYSTIIQQLVGAQTDQTYEITPNTLNDILNKFRERLSADLDTDSVTTEIPKGGDVVVRIKRRDS